MVAPVSRRSSVKLTEDTTFTKGMHLGQLPEMKLKSNTYEKS